jgi:hypothetical protein
MVRPLITAALGAALLAGFGLPAQAQNPQPAPPGVTPPPVAPPNAANPPPEKLAPRDDAGTDARRHRGTITPPNVDPGMAVQPPAGSQGTMPVLPPPGTPGGNRNVQPR